MLFFHTLVFLVVPTASTVIDDWKKMCLEAIRESKIESELKATNLFKKPRLVDIKESGDIFVLDSRLVGPQEFTVFSADGAAADTQKVLYGEEWHLWFGRDPACKKQNSNLTICYEYSEKTHYVGEEYSEYQHLKKTCGELNGIFIQDIGDKFQIFSSQLYKQDALKKDDPFKCGSENLLMGNTSGYWFGVQNVAFRKAGVTFHVHGGGPECCLLNLTMIQNPKNELGHSKCHFVWKTLKVCVTQQQQAQLCNYTYKVGYAPKVTDTTERIKQFGKYDMGLSIAEASSKIVAEISNKFENEFDTTQKIDDTVEYLKEHADYGEEEERTGKIEIPAYYLSDVEIRQLVYRCYGVEAQTDIVDTFTDDPVKLENVFEREQQLKEAVGIKDYYCQL